MYWVREVVTAKAPAPMLVTELGIARVVSDEAPANAALPILVTELGIDNVVSDLALPKAL